MAADGERLAVANVEAKQGRLSEAEADARKALLGILGHQGKYNPESPQFIIGLAGILVEQGRYEEAEKLARSALEVERTLGIADAAPMTVGILAQLGNILMLQRKDADAASVYAELDKAVAQWEPRRRAEFELNGSRIMALYAAGQLDAGIAAAQELVKRQVARTGENHFDAAAAHGTLAVGYARAGREADAIREFKAAIPVMMAAARENADDDDTTLVAARSQHLQRIVESYIGLLARDPAKSSEVAAETFGLADAVRGHSVQQALEASSARLTAADPALAELVRTEQDLGKADQRRSSARSTTRSRCPRASATSRASPPSMPRSRSCAASARRPAQDINRRFPSYADLVDPKPPSVDADQGDVAARRSAALVLLRPECELRMGGAQGRHGRLRAGSSSRRSSSRPRCAGCARRWSRRRRRSPKFRPSILRSPTSFMRRCLSRSRTVGAKRRA